MQLPSLQQNIDTEAEQISAPSSAGKKTIVIVTDLSAKNDRLTAMISRFRNLLPCESRLIDLAEFPFAGGCLGCFKCATDGTCVYKDGFDSFLREQIQQTDAIIYAFSIKDHSMGALFKQYDDRQFCNGHRTVTMGKPVGYLIDGHLSAEPNLSTLIEARAEVGGNHLAGIATNETDAEHNIDRLAGELIYSIVRHYEQPRNFYGVGGLKIFRDLIYLMQGLMREDHRFYKQNGFYDDFPQKHRGRILAMYAIGKMMTSRNLSKKLSGKVTEGMLLPYQKVFADHNN